MSTSPQDHGIKRKVTADDRDDTSPQDSPTTKRPRVASGTQTKGATVQKILADAKALKKRSHKKKAVVPQTAPGTNATPVDFPRPWLKRRQTLPEQTVWLIHAHDNLVPGATKAKPWKDVAEEFNEHFKDVLAKPLAHKTLSKRVSDSRAQFLAHNPEYPEKPTYPVPMYDPEADDEEQPVGNEDVDMSEDEDEIDEADARMSQPNESPMIPDDASAQAQEDFVQLEQLNETIIDGPFPTTPAQRSDNEIVDATPPESGDVPAPIVATHFAPTTTNTNRPAYSSGVATTSSISEHNIPVIDRVKYHLRHRTDEEVAFRFLNQAEEDIDRQGNEYVDYDIFVEASPAYSRYARKNPDKPVPVPKHFGTKTVNAFCQMISPVRATQLPTHYLWRSKNPVPGVYDRFGAVTPEKIHWSIDSMMELYSFARDMEVFWICDMIVDRIHWMYTKQTQMQEACQKDVTKNGFMEVNGHMKHVGGHLPTIPDLQDFSLDPGDFGEVHLNRLAAEPVDQQGLTFTSDIIEELDGEPSAKWMYAQSKQVQDIFIDARGAPMRQCLDKPMRAEFCARYHQHQPDEPCYTSYVPPSERSLLDQLYTAESHDQLLKLSTNVSPPNSLEAIVYSQSADMGELLADNSTPEMLEAEKQLLLMETQLEKAKAAMEKARHAARGEKESALEAAKKLMWKK